MAALPSEDPRRLFVSSVLERCVRLSYWDRMAKLVTPPMLVLLPPRPAPLHKFTDGLLECTVAPRAYTSLFGTIGRAQTRQKDFLKTKSSTKSATVKRPTSSSLSWTVRCALSVHAKNYPHYQVLLPPNLRPVITWRFSCRLYYTLARRPSPTR